MPVEPAAQPCEVCGVETTQRCSSCVKAGIDLFFCSKDHQKLVWPAHKTVCGPGKAHPFAVTPLSHDELVTLTNHLDDAPHDGDVCMRAQLEAVSGERAEILLNHLLSPTDGSSEASRRAPILYWIRYGTRALQLDEEPAADQIERLGKRSITYFDWTSASSYVGKTVLFVCARLRTLRVVLDGVDPPWLSLLQHKALIIIRLSQVTYSQVLDRDPQVIEWSDKAEERLERWIRSGMGTGNPIFERALSSWAGFEAEASTFQVPGV